MNAADLLSQRALPDIRHMTFIGAAPERVYRALTVAAEWNAWFTDETSLDLRIGGFIALRWRGWGAERVDVDDGGPVLEIVPNRSFAFQWSPGSAPTTVRFELEPQGAGTRVTVTDSGWLGDAGELAAYMNCATGWGEALTLLKFYLEHGVTYGKAPPVAPRRES